MIPVEVAELTPAWLTDVLGAEVRTVQVLDAHSGTTGRVRLALDGGTDVPPTVFVKLAPFDPRQREFVRRAGMGTSEARFYETFAGRAFPVPVPDARFAAHDDDGRYVMVLEDLQARAVTFPSPRHDDVARRARATVAGMARLHAAFWESPRFDGGDLAWVPARAGHGAAAGARRGADGVSLVAQVREHLDEYLNDSARRLADLYLAHAPAILDLWDEGPRTLVHGDAHMGNLYNDDEEGAAPRTGFLDWAMVAHAPGIRDVAYYCCSSLPPAVRRAEEATLLREYGDALTSMEIAVDTAALEEQYRLFALTGWIACATTALMGSRWQAERIGFGGLARANAAVEDLDTVAALAARLDVRA